MVKIVLLAQHQKTISQAVCGRSGLFSLVAGFGFRSCFERKGKGPSQANHRSDEFRMTVFYKTISWLTNKEPLGCNTTNVIFQEARQSSNLHKSEMMIE